MRHHRQRRRLGKCCTLALALTIGKWKSWAACRETEVPADTMRAPCAAAAVLCLHVEKYNKLDMGGFLHNERRRKFFEYFKMYEGGAWVQNYHLRRRGLAWLQNGEF